MKRILLLLVMVAIGLLGYRIYTYQPPPEKRYAPPGTFFLLRYVSAPTLTGVIGLTPGEEVRIVKGKSAPGTRLVTDGQHQFEVAQTDLTDDLDVADSVRTEDRTRQKTAADTLAAEKIATEKAIHKREVEMAKKAQEDIARWQAERPPRTSPLDPPPRR